MSDPYGPPPPDEGPGQPGQQPPPYQYGQQPPQQPPYPQQSQPAYGQPYGQAYGQPHAGYPYAQQRGSDGLTTDERTWGGAAHWSALVAALVALAFLGPLVVLLAKGNQSAYVRAQASESLNFQLSMLIYGAVGVVVGVVVTLVTFGLGALLFIPLALAFAAWWLVFTIIGSVKSANGEVYRYPLTLRMVS